MFSLLHLTCIVLAEVRIALSHTPPDADSDEVLVVVRVVAAVRGGGGGEWWWWR